MKDPKSIFVKPETSLLDTLRVIDESARQLALVVDDSSRLLGTVTDGDIRRIVHRFGSVDHLKVLQVMTRNPKTIDREQLLATAVRLMEANPEGPITSLIIVDGEGRPDGVLHLHDCLRLGIGTGARLA